MSWSVSATGTPEQVLENVKNNTNYQLDEPEESIKQAALVAIKIALRAMPKDRHVSLSAFGSQSRKWDGEKYLPEVENSLSISLS